MKKVVALLVIVSLHAMAGWYSSDDNEYKYKGNSGQKYKYDLNKQSDRNNYDADLATQNMDKLNAPINPNVQMDRSQGQYGGGIKW